MRVMPLYCFNTCKEVCVCVGGCSFHRTNKKPTIAVRGSPGNFRITPSLWPFLRETAKAVFSAILVSNDYTREQCLK